MRYTVRQLADLAGVSPRTLHFYDQIGLLKPDAYGENRYRYYGEAALLRLQQILFFKELDFSLTDIRATIDRPGFDTLRALRAHRETLQERAGRLARLIETVDKTILHLKGELEMTEREFYQGFSEEKQQEYEEEVRKRYGDQELKQSQQRWSGYGVQQKQAIQDDFHRIVTGLRDRMGSGHDAPEVQALVGQLHAWVGNFYDCPLDLFEGLGHTYSQDPRFREMYETTYGPGVAEFLERAIGYYCERQRAD
jgi:MerR family transcriptional regulator, thiopeptide resistance regulator